MFRGSGCIGVEESKDDMGVGLERCGTCGDGGCERTTVGGAIMLEWEYWILGVAIDGGSIKLAMDGDADARFTCSGAGAGVVTEVATGGLDWAAASIVAARTGSKPRTGS